MEAEVREVDYLAVYDKKLLWRANLYIDEGNSDWNDVHPWRAPPDANQPVPGPNGNPVWGCNAQGQWDAERWGYNEWNRRYDTEDSITALTALPAGNGGQCMALQPWTRWSDDATVRGNVAYGWGCWDAVWQFNQELAEQRDLISEVRNPTSNVFQGWNYLGLTWTNEAVAPGGVWDNYIFPKRR